MTFDEKILALAEIGEKAKAIRLKMEAISRRKPAKRPKTTAKRIAEVFSLLTQGRSLFIQANIIASQPVPKYPKGSN